MTAMTAPTSACPRAPPCWPGWRCAPPPTGTVKNVRDGVPDHTGTDADVQAAKGRECGNGVVVTHPAGWETQYCHLKNGSVRVRPGQTRRRRRRPGPGRPDRRGRLSSRPSGACARTERRSIPFSYGARPLACGSGGRGLWSPAAQAALPYRAPEVLNAGFAAAPVTQATIDAGTTGPAPNAASPNLLAFVRAIGLDAGDVQTLSVTGPAGFAAEQTVPALERPRAEHFLFTGRRNRAGRWPSGAYQARYVVRRRGQVVLEHRFQHAL
jgi:hypothetical protein